MIAITVQRSPVNIEALDAEVRAAFGPLTTGVSADPAGITVYLLDSATSAQAAKARALIIAHDPNQLTPAQQIAMQQQAKLEQTRRDNAARDLDVSAYAAQPDLIQQLARKIAWLEQEIAALRGK
jgi:hypothetical protein